MFDVPDFIQFKMDHFIGLLVVIGIWTGIAKGSNQFEYIDTNNKQVKSFTYYSSESIRTIALIGLIICVIILIYGAISINNLSEKINEYYRIKESYNPISGNYAYSLDYNDVFDMEQNIRNKCFDIKDYISYTQFFLPIFLITYIWDKISISNRNYYLNTNQSSHINNTSHTNHINNTENIKSSSNHMNNNKYANSSDDDYNIRYNKFISSDLAGIMYSNLLLCMGLTKYDIETNKQTKDYFTNTFNNLVAICLSTDIPHYILSSELSNLLNRVSKNQSIRNQFEYEIRKLFNIPL